MSIEKILEYVQLNNNCVNPSILRGMLEELVAPKVAEVKPKVVAKAAAAVVKEEE